MTDTRLALLAEIIAHPEDDVRRLAYADLLEESGEGERAEFCRVQCELAKGEDESIRHNRPIGLHPAMQCDWPCLKCQDRNRVSRLRRRERELFHDIALPELSSGLFDGLRLTGRELDECELPVKGLVSRGLISSIACTAEDWLRVAPLLHWHPSQTEECVECLGNRLVSLRHEGPLPGGQMSVNVDCQACHATGRAPRPCPPTAQPIERATLTGVTTEFVLEHRLQPERPGERIFWLSPEWEGVEFTLWIVMPH